MKPEIRPARGEEADRLTEIAFAAKRFWGYPDDMIALWVNELTVSKEYIDSHPVFVAEMGDAIAGWYSIGEEDAVAMVDYCWVDPQWIGRGLGRLMLEHMQAHLRKTGKNRVKVVSDPNAEGFYEKMGFRTVELFASLPPGRDLPVMEWETK